MLERFALARVIYGKPEMVKSESYGQWVRYSDALELEAENDELKAKLATTEKALELSCKHISDSGYCMRCPLDEVCVLDNRNCVETIKDYFLQQAKIEGEK